MENRVKVLSPMLEQTTYHESINLVFLQTLNIKNEQNSIFYLDFSQLFIPLSAKKFCFANRLSPSRLSVTIRGFKLLIGYMGREMK